jgi:hypothetical protein
MINKISQQGCWLFLTFSFARQRSQIVIFLKIYLQRDLHALLLSVYRKAIKKLTMLSQIKGGSEDEDECNYPVTFRVRIFRCNTSTAKFKGCDKSANFQMGKEGINSF